MTWGREGRDVQGYFDGERAFTWDNLFFPPGYDNATIGNGCCDENYSVHNERFWIGLIDEVSIYDRILSGEEIEAVFETSGVGG